MPSAYGLLLFRAASQPRGVFALKRGYLHLPGGHPLMQFRLAAMQ
jgi:hypothetical protein